MNVNSPLKHILFVVLCITTLVVAASFLHRQLSPQYPIVSIDSFSQAQDVLDAADAKTIILFDLDDTLIDPVDHLACYAPSLWFKFKIIFKHPSLIWQENIKHYYSIMWQQTKWYVIEPSIIDTINELKKRGCTVLALSSMETGSFGTIENFPHWRSEELKSLGIEFSQTIKNTVFYKLPSCRGNYPELYRGILCCNQQSKGAVVGALRDSISWFPSRIIFFDDSMRNVESVAQECKKRRIPFTGFEYRGAKAHATERDEKMMEQQLDYLIEHDQWIGDEETHTLRNA